MSDTQDIALTPSAAARDADKAEPQGKPALLRLTDQLSRRQKRLQQATYDLSTGKNR